MKHINICPHRKKYAKCIQRKLIYNAGNLNEQRKILDVHTCSVACSSYILYESISGRWYVLNSFGLFSKQLSSTVTDVVCRTC